MSLLLRDCVGTHARVRSSSRVRAPLAPAPRESWGTVRSKHCHSHEPHRETPLWGEGNRPKRLGARPMAGGDSSLRQRSKLPRHDPPPQLSAGPRPAFGARGAAGRRLGPQIRARS